MSARSKGKKFKRKNGLVKNIRRWQGCEYNREQAAQKTENNHTTPTFRLDKQLRQTEGLKDRRVKERHPEKKGGSACKGIPGPFFSTSESGPFHRVVSD